MESIRFRNNASICHILRNVSTLKVECTSRLKLRNLDFQLFMKPFLECVDGKLKRFLSCSVACLGEANASSDWSMNVGVTVEIEHEEGQPQFSQTAQHLFTGKTPTFSFKKFISWELLEYAKYIKPNDTLALNLGLQVLSEPHGVSFNSKSQTGYVGLLNRENRICYMNCQLQSLFHILPLQKAIVNCKPELIRNNTNKRIMIALKKIFKKMSYSKKPVSSSELLHAFIGTSLEVEKFNDAHDFFLRLFEAMSNSFNEMFSPLSNIMTRLFVGQSAYRVCVIDENTSFLHGFASFGDICLAVTDSSSVTQSLRNEMREELFTGDNKIEIELEGSKKSVDASRKLVIQQLPPILSLPIKKFKWGEDEEGNFTSIKIDPWFAFEEQLDLTEFLVPGSPKTVYDLYSIIVHSGDSKKGHYVSFIKKQNQWFKFNDAVVTKCTQDEAVMENYGGKGTGEPSAYMLVYIDKASIDLPQCSTCYALYLDEVCPYCVTQDSEHLSESNSNSSSNLTRDQENPNDAQPIKNNCKSPDSVQLPESKSTSSSNLKQDQVNISDSQANKKKKTTDQSFRKLGNGFLVSLDHRLQVPAFIRQGAEKLYERSATEAENGDTRYRVKALAAASFLKAVEKEVKKELFLSDPRCSLQDFDFASELVDKLDKMKLQEEAQEEENKKG